MVQSPRTGRSLSLLAVVLVGAAVVGVAVAATVVTWGYLLPPQHGLYHPGTGTGSFGSLSINNTTVTLSQNGSWYSVGFYSNVSVTVFLNVSGGAGQLTIDTLSASEFHSLVNNQTFTPNNQSTGVNTTFLQHYEALAGAADYWVFLNTGTSAISPTFNLNVG